MAVRLMSGGKLPCYNMPCALMRGAKMMGQQRVQDRLFYSFNLEDHIPANHLLRAIDSCLDLKEVRRTWKITTVPPDVLRSIPK